jgi:hypothetical protein
VHVLSKDISYVASKVTGTAWRSLDNGNTGVQVLSSSRKLRRLQRIYLCFSLLSEGFLTSLVKRPLFAFRVG